MQLQDQIRWDEVQVSEEYGKFSLQVPWLRAEQWQSNLRNAGIGSTLHLDPLQRQARLEPWTNLTAERLRELVNGKGEAAVAVG